MHHSNTGVHARFINLKDNVPFLRVYRSMKIFKQSYGRMKDARLIDALDFNTYTVIHPSDLH